MAIKVYGMVLSNPTAVVLTALHDKEVDYELVHVDLMTGANRMPEHLALQPFGQLPVLVDEALTLFGKYLTLLRFNLPILSLERLRVTSQASSRAKELIFTGLRRSIALSSSQNYSPVTAAIAREIYIYGDESDEVALLVHFEKLNKVLDVYEARLTNSRYLAGEFFSLADLAHLPSLNFLISIAKRGHILEGRPHVKAWWEDISSRPAWKTLSAPLEHEYDQFRSSMKLIKETRPEFSRTEDRSH